MPFRSCDGAYAPTSFRKGKNDKKRTDAFNENLFTGIVRSNAAGKFFDSSFRRVIGKLAPTFKREPNA